MVEKIEVNLIPNEYRIHSKSIKIPQDILLSVLASLIAISVAFGVFYWKKQRRDEIVFEIESLTKEITQLESKEKKIQELKKNQELFRDMRNGLNSIHVDRDTWIRLFEIYCRELPENTWLLSLEGTEIIPDPPAEDDKKTKNKTSKKKKKNEKTPPEEKVIPVPKGPIVNNIKIEGRTNSFGEVGQFMARLQSTPNISGVKIQEVKSLNPKIKKLDSKESSFSFEIKHQYTIPRLDTLDGNSSSKNKKKGR